MRDKLAREAIEKLAIENDCAVYFYNGKAFVSGIKALKRAWEHKEIKEIIALITQLAESLGLELVDIPAGREFRKKAKK